MTAMRWLALLFALGALLAPAAHALELANKLRLDGPLWLAVQQRLYQGWGPLIGGPTEIGALLLNLALAFAGVAPLRRRAPWLLAACVYAGMIAVFFTFNAPVNAAVSHWTPEGLPPDWPAYRSRWEFGHALAAALAIAGLALTFWGFEWNRKR